MAFIPFGLVGRLKEARIQINTAIVFFLTPLYALLAGSLALMSRHFIAAGLIGITLASGLVITLVFLAKRHKWAFITAVTASFCWLVLVILGMIQAPFSGLFRLPFAIAMVTLLLNNKKEFKVQSKFGLLVPTITGLIVVFLLILLTILGASNSLIERNQTQEFTVEDNLNVDAFPLKEKDGSIQWIGVMNKENMTLTNVHYVLDSAYSYTIGDLHPNAPTKINIAWFEDEEGNPFPNDELPYTVDLVSDQGVSLGHFEYFE